MICSRLLWCCLCEPPGDALCVDGLVGVPLGVLHAAHLIGDQVSSAIQGLQTKRVLQVNLQQEKRTDLKHRAGFRKQVSKGSV